ncbi:Uma2 family endonuclease [soil metagenome]
MAQHFTVAEYLETDETSRRRELVHGELREPPAPAYGHQAVVTRLVALFHTHVERHRLGHVCVSPLDVILDAERDLILQPDIVFVSSERAGIIRDRIWGAPDLVVEVLSPSTREYDRRTKVDLYQQYGVRECWLLDPVSQSIDVVTCSPPPVRRVTFGGDEPVRSKVFPEWRLEASRHFG